MTQLPGIGRVIFARHGETAENVPPVRLMGQRDPPLTKRGIAQAAELARAAREASVAAIYTSPLRRALHTAQIVGREIGVDPVVDARLMESARGFWEGRTVQDIAHEEPDLWAAWQRPAASFRFPGGESLEEHITRVGDALSDLALAPRPVLAVSHGGTIRCALMIAHGVPVEEFHALRVPNATMFDLEAPPPIARVRT